MIRDSFVNSKRQQIRRLRPLKLTA